MDWGNVSILSKALTFIRYFRPYVYILFIKIRKNGDKLSLNNLFVLVFFFLLGF